MAKDKFLYQTNINKKTEVDVPTKEMVDGKEATVVRKETKEVPVSVKLLSPSRKLRDESEIYHASTVHGLIGKGVMNRHVLRKHLVESGGVFTTGETNEYGDLLKKMQDITIEYQRLLLIKKEDLKEEEKKRLETIQDEYSDIQSKILQVEQAQQNLFANCAEAIADRKLSTWWLLNLLEVDSKPMFEGVNEAEKYTKYDELEEKGDEFDISVVSRALLVIELWKNGMASNQGDFDRLITEVSKEEDKETPPEDKKEVKP